MYAEVPCPTPHGNPDDPMDTSLLPCPTCGAAL